MKNDIIPPLLIRKEELHSGLQDEEYLSSLEKNLDDNFEKEMTTPSTNELGKASFQEG